MASISLKKTKAGKDFYEIRCHVGRDRPTLSTRWYTPEGWSQKSIDKELNKVAAEFERKCQNGEVLSRSEQVQKDAAEAQKRAYALMTDIHWDDCFCRKDIGWRAIEREQN